MINIPPEHQFHVFILSIAGAILATALQLYFN